MPRKFKLNWDKNLEYFYKRDSTGRKICFGKAASKYREPEPPKQTVPKKYLRKSRLQRIPARTPRKLG
jgi:hypothetical protein